MPVYEYRCKSCGETHEISHGFNDDRPTKCPTCGGQLIRVFHPIGVVFKGSGFHKTDYTKSGVRAQSSDSQGEKSGDTKPSEGKPVEGKAGDNKSGEGKSSESKPGQDKPSGGKSTESKPSESKSSESKASPETKPAKSS